MSSTLDATPVSPGGVSITSEAFASPFRLPPPYKPPPEVSSMSKSSTSVNPISGTGTAVESESAENYRDCINEFASAVSAIEPSRIVPKDGDKNIEESVSSPKPQTSDAKHKVERQISVESVENKENIARFSFSSGTPSTESTSSTSTEKAPSDAGTNTENPMSVKEATKKFNRMASEEEAKVISPQGKKKPEKVSQY